MTPPSTAPQLGIVKFTISGTCLIAKFFVHPFMNKNMISQEYSCRTFQSLSVSVLGESWIDVSKLKHLYLSGIYDIFQFPFIYDHR